MVLIDNTTAEHFSNTLESSKVGIIAASAAITGISLLLLIGLLIGKGKISAKIAVCCVQWFVVIALSLTTWGITYDKMKESVQKQVQNLIISVSEDLKSKVSNELDVAIKLNKMHVMLNNMSLATTNDSLATVWLMLQAKWFLYDGEERGSLGAVYTGNRLGYTAYLGKGGTIFAAWPRGYSTLPQDFRCTVNGQPPGGSRQLCEGLTSNFTFPLVNMAWDVTLQTEGYFPPNFVLHLDPTSTFDPRVRPWYVYTDGPSWSDPYAFVPEGVGLTTTMGTRLPNGDWDGIIAVDFDVFSLRSFIMPLVPTDNSVILMYTSKGILLSGSLTGQQMSNNTGSVAHTLNVWLSNEPTIKRIVTVVRDRIGEVAPTHPMIFHQSKHIVLTTPLVVTGGLYVMITVDIPYKDVLGDAEHASTTALLLVFVLSLGCMALVSGGVAVMMRPLETLAYNMDMAAWMKVEAIKPVASSITELTSMINSFDIMVGNLVEYKKYLPDSLLAAQSETEEEGSQGASSNKDSTTKKSMSKGSVKRSSRHSAATSVLIKAQVFSSELTEKRVSIAVLRLGGVGDMVRSSSTYCKFHTAYSEFLECVQHNTKEQKGTVDSLVGDKATLAFNAAVTNSAHRPRMCNALLHIHSSTKGKLLSIGATTGTAVCGNCGSSTLKTFKVFGKCVGVARGLEQMCRPAEAIYISEQLMQVMETTYTVMKLFKVQFVTMSQPQLIAELICKKDDDQHEGEWMYALQDAECPYTHYNKAVEYLMDGDYIEASACLKKSPLPDNINERLRERIEACKISKQLEAPQEFFTDEF
eukprot:TRINITY_DN30165_c0_g1_i1.p1 TRINITY_DN30165_c0_g1~~TRINITY_DN30165_c0_g1_i1.p1  ORF type:complete len:807 (+),score=189.60 TRINITY_DN30165_c0_g1_i1:60-2480(+)